MPRGYCVRGGERMKRTPEEYKKIAQEILDVLARNHMRRNESYSLLSHLADSINYIDVEVNEGMVDLSFCDD